MKAKEWAAKFQGVPVGDQPVEECFVEILNEYGEETAKLVAERTKSSKEGERLPAAEGAVREQRMKFCAVCKYVPGLIEPMFDNILLSSVPQYQEWQKAAAAKVEQKKDDVASYRSRGRQFRRETRNVQKGNDHSDAGKLGRSS